MGKKCSYPNCNTRACYNYNGYKFGLYCSKHKLVDMINIETPTCKVDNCNIIALYNYKDKSNAIYCNTHKLENMINIRKKETVDLKRKIEELKFIKTHLIPITYNLQEKFKYYP